MTSRKEYGMLFSISAQLAGSFKGSFGKAAAEVAKLQTTMKALNDRTKDISAFTSQQKSLEKSKNSLESLQKAHDRLTTQLSDANKVLEAHQAAEVKDEKAIAAAQKEVNNLTFKLEDNEVAIAKTTKAIKNQGDKLAETTENLKKAGINTDNLSKENDKLTKTYEKLNTAKKNLDGIRAAQEANREAITKTKTELLKTTGAIAAVGAVMYKGAVQPAIEYESAFAGVKKTVNGTPEQFEAISKAFTKMSTEIPVSRVELAELGEAAGQLGIKADNIAEFTRVIADLGVATNLGGAEGAATLAKFANITQMSENDYNNLGSSIVALGNNFATTEADIAAMGLRLAGAGKQSGLTEAEILGLSAGLSSVGIEAEAGGSAFSKVLKNMQLASELGGESLDQFAKVAGMSSKEFAKRYKNDASGALLEFIKGLNNTERNGQSAVAVLDEMGISEVRMSDALLRAAGAGDVFSDAIKLSSEAWEKHEALTNEANQRYETTESKMQMAKNSIENLGGSVGQLLLPQIGKLADSLIPLITKLTDFINENPEVIKQIGLIGAGLAGLKVGSLVGELGLGELQGGILKASEVFGKFKLKQAEAAAEALTSGGKFAKVGKDISGYFGGIKEAGSKVKILGEVGDKLKNIGGGIQNSPVLKFAEKFKKIGGTVKDNAIFKIGEKFKAIGNAASNNPIFKFAGKFQGLGDVIGKVAGGPLKLLSSGLGGLFGKVMPIIAIVSLLAAAFVKLSGGDVTAFIEPIRQAFENAKPTIEAIMAQFKSMGETLMPMLLTAAQALMPLLGQLVGAILPVILSLVQSLMPIIQTIVETVLPIIINLITTLAPAFTDLITAIMPMIQKVLPVLVELFSIGLTAAIEAVKPVIDSLIKVFKGVIDFITGIFTGNLDKALGGLKDIFSGAFEAIKNIVMAPLKFIGDAVSKLFAKIKGINGTKVNADVSADGSVSIDTPAFATGSRYTPSAFIAGERGAELITNAKGRTVFTAAQTSRIMENVRPSENIPAPQLSRSAMPSTGGSPMTVTFSPIITVHANGDGGDIGEQIKAALENAMPGLVARIENIQRDKRENEVRMAYA